MSTPTALACVLASYLLGSVSFALLLARTLRGVDLRNVGSGNLGATNAGRVLGRRWGLLVYLLDFMKGFLPVVVGEHLLEPWDVAGGFLPLPLLMGAAAFLGHCHPFYLGLRGGKGVATGSGVVLAVSWPVFVAVIAAFLLTVLVSRMISLGSMVAAVVLPVAYLAVERRDALKAPGLAWLTLFLALAILVIVRHRANVHRIVEGTEPRIGRRTS